MSRTTPPRLVDVTTIVPEIASFARPALRLHPRRGEPGLDDSSVAGPLLWPTDDPWSWRMRAADAGLGSPWKNRLSTTPIFACLTFSATA